MPPARKFSRVAKLAELDLQLSEIARALCECREQVTSLAGWQVGRSAESNASTDLDVLARFAASRFRGPFSADEFRQVYRSFLPAVTAIRFSPARNGRLLHRLLDERVIVRVGRRRSNRYRVREPP